MEAKTSRLINLAILFVTLILFFIFTFKLLNEGIYIRSFSVADAKFEGLYLKVEKKLIVTLDRLDISKQFAKSSTSEINVKENIEKYADAFKNSLVMLANFQKLEIKNIYTGNYNASVLFNGKNFYFDFPYARANFSINDDRDLIILNLNSLIIKNKNIDIKTTGAAYFAIMKKELVFNFDLIINKNIKFSTTGYSNFDEISLFSSSNRILKIDFIYPFLKDLKNQAPYEWIAKRSSFSSVKLLSFSFKARYGEFLQSFKDSMRAHIVTTDANVKFNDALSPINARVVNLIFKNNALYFDITRPRYQNWTLDGSSVKIKNLIDAHPLIMLKLVSKDASANNDLAKILAAYDIPLPIRQEKLSINSYVDTNLLLKFQLRGDHLPPFAYVSGYADSYRTRIRIDNTNFDIVRGLTTFNITPKIDEIAIDAVDTTFSNMMNVDAKLLVLPKEGKIKAVATPNIIHITTSASKKRNKSIVKTANQTSSNDDMKISYTKNDTDILYITRKELDKIPFEVDFNDKDKTTVSLSDFDLKMNFGEEFELNCNEINKIAKYSPVLNLIDISRGSVNLKSKDFENFTIEAVANDLKFPIYYKNGELLSSLKLNASITPQAINIASSDESVNIKIKNNKIDIGLMNYNINLNQLLISKIPVLSTIQSKPEVVEYSQITDGNSITLIKEKNAPVVSRTTDNAVLLNPKNIDNTKITTSVIGKNLGIIYNKFFIPTNNTQLRIRASRFDFDATYISGMANIVYVDNKIYIKAENFTSNFINAVTQSDYVKGGRFSLLGVYDSGVFKGEIDISNTSVSNLTTLSEILGFIDTVPSLIMFKTPSLGGYKISTGKIFFGYNGDYLGIEKLNIIGNSMDISGFGIVDIAKNNIDMSLQLTTLKQFSKILRNIPIVGFLILGKDGKASTNLTIKGNLKNPQINVSLLQDIIFAPFMIIKRIFTPVEDGVNGIEKVFIERNKD